MQYTVQPGDTLASVAEAHGHSGEWRVLAEINQGGDNTEPGALWHGTELEVPDEWAEPVEAEPLEVATGTGWVSAGELVERAQNTQTLAELDAIEAQADGRVTVLNAVANQRQVLEASGITG